MAHDDSSATGADCGPVRMTLVIRDRVAKVIAEGKT
jgi:hypothetical protein